MKKKILLIIFLIVPLFANVIINKEYKYDILNSKLKNIPTLYTYSDLEQAINEQYGYSLYSYIPEIEGNKKYYKDNSKNIGDLLFKIADNFNAAVSVNEKKGKIVFKELYSNFVNLPNNWDMEGTEKDLQLNYPEINFKINGNRIYAYGSESQIKKVTPILQNIEYITNSPKHFFIRVLPYYTQDKENEFIGYRKDLGNAMEEPQIPLEKTITLKHDDTFTFQYYNKLITVKLNLVKQNITFDNNYVVPLSDISSVGLVFTVNIKKEELWHDKTINKKFILEVSPTNGL